MKEYMKREKDLHFPPITSFFRMEKETVAISYQHWEYLSIPHLDLHIALLHHLYIHPCMFNIQMSYLLLLSSNNPEKELLNCPLASPYCRGHFLCPCSQTEIETTLKLTCRTVCCWIRCWITSQCHLHPYEIKALGSWIKHGWGLEVCRMALSDSDGASVHKWVP